MTIDKRRAPTAPHTRTGTLPAFTPVPRQCSRHDGWTAERQRGFIEALATTGSVRAAAHAVNMAPEGAYQLRRHPEAASFRKAWEAALALGVQRLEDIAMDRALNGVEVPVYSYGKLVGTRLVHNDRLLMFLLRHRAPNRFAADARAGGRRGGLFDPAEANRLSRLKARWRKEWDEERATEDRAASEEEMEAIMRKIDHMAENHLASMTPRTRALYEAYRAAEAEDRAAGRYGWDEDSDEDADDSGLAGEDGEDRDDPPAPHTPQPALPAPAEREGEPGAPGTARVRTVKDG